MLYPLSYGGGVSVRPGGGGDLSGSVGPGNSGPNGPGLHLTTGPDDHPDSRLADGTCHVRGPVVR